MAVAIEVVNFTAAVAGVDEVGRILIAQQRQGLIEMVLFDMAMGRQIPTCGAARNQVSAREQG